MKYSVNTIRPGQIWKWGDEVDLEFRIYKVDATDIYYEYMPEHLKFVCTANYFLSQAAVLVKDPHEDIFKLLKKYYNV